jgi:hypothetical protein
MGLWTGRPRNSGSTRARSLPWVQTGSRSSTLLCRGTEWSFFGDEVAGALTLPSEEIKNVWSNTSTLPYVLMFA